MGDIRPVKKSGDIERLFGVEDGKHYRKWRQETGPALQHVADTNALIQANGPSKGWEYRGSIPFVMILDWLKDKPYSLHDFAAQKDVRKEFLKHFFSRDYSKFHGERPA